MLAIAARLRPRAVPSMSAASLASNPPPLSLIPGSTVQVEPRILHFTLCAVDPFYEMHAHTATHTPTATKCLLLSTCGTLTLTLELKLTLVTMNSGFGPRQLWFLLCLWGRYRAVCLHVP